MNKLQKWRCQWHRAVRALSVFRISEIRARIAALESTVELAGAAVRMLSAKGGGDPRIAILHCRGSFEIAHGNYRDLMSAALRMANRSGESVAISEIVGMCRPSGALVEN